MLVFISIAMYLLICRYDDQAFDDMGEECEKKTLLLRNSCSLFQVKALLSRPKKWRIKTLARDSGVIKH